MQAEVNEIFVHDAIYDYLARLVAQTRSNTYIELGGSPRATLALMRMSMAAAYLKGRDYVLPEDVQDVFLPVMKHRIVKGRRARVDKVSEEEILTTILQKEHRPAQKKA